MSQATIDFDWTTAQPVEEDDTSATLAATTFGQRSMPAPTQGPVNVDTEFDWKTATLDEPFDPTTAQPMSEQEEHQFYQDLEAASRDPQRILTNTEHSLLYDHRQQQDDAVARFFEGAEDIPGNLVSLGMDAGREIKQNFSENLFRPDRFAARNLATGMETVRKAGVQLLQLFDWGQNKVADIIQRGNANDAKMREIAASIPKTGDERVDGDNVMAAIAKARDEGVFNETPFGPDKETDYERYLQQNSYARSHAGNITEATMGGKTMTFPNEQTAVLGQQPMQSVATVGAMVVDPINAIPLGAGVFSKLRVLRRLSRVTGMPLPAVERGLAWAADGMEDFGSGVAARVTEKTGLSKTQQVATLSAVSGGSALLAANTDGMDGVLLPVAALSGVVPLYKAGGGTIRKTSQAAGTGAMVLREMRAGNIGVVRQAAADDLLRTGAVPPQYAAYMRPYANGVESTLGRMAKNPDNPEITRKLARLADNAGVTQAVRLADDAVSSGIAATLASTPFAMLAPDAEQAGAIVGGAATLGTFAGPIAGAVGRRSSRVDADIARMLIDVHAVNGDVPALISLGRDRLGQIAGMQGVVAGKTDFVTLRASDYRANVDVRQSGAETAAGVFVEKASNGTARVFINLGEPASMDGKVRVRDRGDGVREVRIRGNDGRTEFIAAPKGRRLLVNDGDTVKVGQQVVDYMPPTRSMPHEIAHAILTSDILDGDIRNDMRNHVSQVYGEDGIKARGREYMAKIVDGDIMFGTHEGAVALTPEEIADVRSGKRTMSDVMKGKPVEAAERDALIEARIDEYNQRSREKGGNDYDWARDEVVAEQFAGEAKGIDFRGIRAGGPKVLESALATSARVLEALGAKFDRTTGKPLDNPSVLFRDNPLFQSPVLRKRMIEHVRAYNDLLAGLEEAGKREARGTKVSVDGTPDSAARSPHTKMRPDPDKGGQVGNEFLYVDETGKTQWRSPSEVRTRETSRTSQAKTLYNPSRILAPSSTEFGLRRTDSGRTIISGPTLPAQFDHFVHFPKWMRDFARMLEASRERGMTFIADYNAIGDGKDGTYRVRNRGDIRAIQREVAFVGWEMTGNKHLKTVLMDLNAFRASAMKAINNGELGIFNNDMQVIEADLRTYLANHRNGLPGEAGIGQAKRDMLNGLIGTGTAVQRKANPLYSDLNPRGSVRSFRLDRYNDLTPTGREGLSFDYDKINNNRMPQQIPRGAQGMPDVAADLRKQKAGDGVAYKIYSDGKMVGHISGFERDGRFHLYKTEMSDSSARGTGLYQKAVQQVADKYDDGLFVMEWESSADLKRALRKLPTQTLVGKEIKIAPSKSANLPGPRGQAMPDVAPQDAPPLDPQFALTDPIVGPTGAKIVGYRWMSQIEEGNYGDRRVSNWSESQTSEPTGRSIVHLYWVDIPNSGRKLMGIGAAQKALGIKQPQLRSIAKREQAAQVSRKAAESRLNRSYEEAAQPTAAEASQRFRKANWSAMRSDAQNEAIFNESELWQKDGRYIRVPKMQTDQMRSYGWKQASAAPRGQAMPDFAQPDGSTLRVPDASWRADSARQLQEADAYFRSLAKQRKEPYTNYRDYANRHPEDAEAFFQSYRERVPYAALEGAEVLPAGDAPVAGNGDANAAPRGASRGTQGNVGRRGQAMPDAAPADAPPFYMKSAQVLDAKIQGKAATPDQVRAILKNPQNGIKAEELKWTGIEQAVERIAKENGGKVPKEALLKYLAEDGAVRLEEVNYKTGDAGMQNLSDGNWRAYAENERGFTDAMFDNEQDAREWVREMQGQGYGTGRFAQYQLPGGENYREVVLTMPSKFDASKVTVGGSNETGWQARLPDLTNYGYGDTQEAAITMLKTRVESGEFIPNAYTSSHFDTPNYVAHMRLNERADAAGKPGLFLEEIQSDRHQAGREKGYAGEDNTITGYQVIVDGNPAMTYEKRSEAEDHVIRAQKWNDPSKIKIVEVQARRQDDGSRIPDAPFRKDWSLQMFKRALRDAVESGKDWIGWTTGETQAARYDLSKQVDSVSIQRTLGGDYQITAEKTGQRVISEGAEDINGVAAVVGKELAQKASKLKEGQVEKYQGVDLKVGGEGMKGFYDQILPKEISKYVKQWGGQVEKADLGQAGNVFKDASSGRWFIELPNGIMDTDTTFATRAEAVKAATGTPIWRVNITPQMREGIKKAGQALFVGGMAAVVAEQEE
jgi:hypothetical protein